MKSFYTWLEQQDVDPAEKLGQKIKQIATRGGDPDTQVQQMKQATDMAKQQAMQSGASNPAKLAQIVSTSASLPDNPDKMKSKKKSKKK
jgi:hypothetical protein